MKRIMALAAGILLSVSVVAANAAPADAPNAPPKGVENSKKAMKEKLAKTKQMQERKQKAADKRALSQQGAK